MARKVMSVSTSGKPTEKTGVPQPPAHSRHQVMDGIVRGVPKGVHTPMPDGVVSGLMPKVSGKVMSVDSGATRHSEQEFGSVPFAMTR